MSKSDFSKGYRFPVSLFIFLIFTLTLQAAEDSPYLQELLARADKKKIHTERYWHILMHYHKSFLGHKSSVDDPQFFLAEDGKTNPRAELRATLRAFFRKEPFPGKVEHPCCQFIGRYHWLKEQLEIDEAKLPAADCKIFEETMKLVKPDRMVLIFPAAYMNNPASMFGHTMLNIKGQSANKLLSQSISYSARAQPTNMVSYAFKGLVGLYKGYYDVLPYYIRVQQYNNIHQRDIWEYELNLTEEEINRMIRHLWELKEIYSDYFFFTENCSYNLFYLLEAARPDVELTDEFSVKTVPIDTIRVLKEKGFIKNTVHRPAQATLIKHLASKLPLDLQKLAKKLSDGEAEVTSVTDNPDLSKEEKIIILDLATEYLQYLHGKKKVSLKVYRQRFLSLLKARSKLGKYAHEVPAPPQPELGHKGNRLAVGIEVDEGKVYNTVEIRPAYHDLLDPEHGHIEGSQVKFFSFKLRHREKIRLDKATFLSLYSLTPKGLFFRPASWKLNVGLERRFFGEDDFHHLFFINGARGAAWDLGPGTAYGLIETELLAGGGLDKDHYSAGVGGELGYLFYLHPKIKCHGLANALHYPISHRHDRVLYQFESRYTINVNHTLRLGVKREQDFHNHRVRISDVFLVAAQLHIRTFRSYLAAPAVHLFPAPRN